jgi:hypothetical protein
MWTELVSHMLATQSVCYAVCFPKLWLALSRLGLFSLPHVPQYCPSPYMTYGDDGNCSKATVMKLVATPAVLAATTGAASSIASTTGTVRKRMADYANAGVMTGPSCRAWRRIRRGY